MVKESQLFFADLIVNNRPASGLIDSDYTFLDERLARHYGIDGLQGPAFKRTKLPPQSPYGGILTQASVLKVTANGTVTSPVLDIAVGTSTRLSSIAHLPYLLWNLIYEGQRPFVSYLPTS